MVTSESSDWRIPAINNIVASKLKKTYHGVWQNGGAESSKQKIIWLQTI